MIIRRKHTANFTTIGNALFNDERLEADEMGILAFLLSRPDDWEVRRPALARRFRIGRDSIKRIMLNLMCAGWVVARRTRLPNGTFHTIYEVRDEPGPTLSAESVKAALSLVSSEATDADEADEQSTDHPPDNGPPPPGEPGAADQLRQTRRGSSKEELLKTDSEKTEPPTGARDFADVTAKWPIENILSDFAAAQAFAALTGALQSACIAGIVPYLDDCRANSRKVCDLTTFIRERRWERFSKAAAGSFFHVKPHTPQEHRWRDYFRATDQQKLQSFNRCMSSGRGYTTTSEWPPAIPKQGADPPQNSAA
jgi:predicted transcriptional regulator